jgi:8-oxo-dGTP diphosphatase
MKMTSLVYLEREGKYLMLHRTKKEDDENRDKWIGVGGKFEEGESPEDCMRREVLEETGLAVTAFRYRGIVTFVLGERQTEYMHLFTATAWSGEEKECDEGELAWIDRDALFDLTLWEGDRIFLRLLREEHPFFSLKLVYSDSGDLLGAVLDGETLAIGNPS